MAHEGGLHVLRRGEGREIHEAQAHERVTSAKLGQVGVRSWPTVSMVPGAASEREENRSWPSVETSSTS
jgi:hypothetical protein